MKSVALIGPDGAGKSTVAQELVRALPVPARYLYMGVNFQSSKRTLPTTRLAFMLKRARGRRVSDYDDAERARLGGRQGLVRSTYSFVRLVAWLAEEWYRAILAIGYNSRGYFVVFDRHFLYDYYASHVVARPGRTLTMRLHGQVLRRLYPRPDLVVCLDAPASDLHARKREQSVEWLEQRRREYLALAAVGPEFVVVDATKPLPDIVADISSLIQVRLEPTRFGIAAAEDPADG